MTDQPQNFTRIDGTYEISAALEHGALLQRKAARLSIRGLLSGLFTPARRTTAETQALASLQQEG